MHVLRVGCVGCGVGCVCEGGVRSPLSHSLSLSLPLPWTQVDGLKQLAFYFYLKSISHLVDPASSHMLSSKAKPCMSKYKGISPKLRTAHYNGRNLHGPILFFSRITLGT